MVLIASASNGEAITNEWLVREDEQKATVSMSQGTQGWLFSSEHQ